MQKNPPYYRRLTRLIGSDRFFWVVVALLVVQAAWIALSGLYPMAFDEDFHLGVIRLYADHLNPFWSAQPGGSDAFGAVFRDPSYLYQYLMSFPYRLITAFTSDQTTQVLLLRAINIGLFASGLVLFRRLLLKTGASRAIVHGCLLVFVLLPVVPLLAAQINYDNAFFPVVALVLLLAVRLDQELREKSRVNTKLLLVLVILSLLGALVKYALLPILIAVALYLVVRCFRTFAGFQAFSSSLRAGWIRLKPGMRWLLVVGLVASSALFIERYGVNIARYHTPVPACDQAISQQQCAAYAPWARDYNWTTNAKLKTEGPVIYMNDWLYGMWLRTFFAVDGPATDFQTRGPLLVPGIASIGLAGATLIVIVVTWRRLLRKYHRPVLGLFLAVAAVYTGLLWVDGYMAYLRTGHTVAINGRYLFPVLPLLLVMGALSWNELLKNRQTLKAVLFIVTIASLLWGGGALTYILRSNDAWYRPDSTVRSANRLVRDNLGPLTPGWRQPTLFMSRN